MFYNMLDIAALSALRLYELSHPAWHVNKQEKRKVFLKELAMQLAEPHLQNRCDGKMQSSVKMAMEMIHFKPKSGTKRSMPEVQVNNKRRRCDFCKGTPSENNKTSGMCDHCLKAACPIHYVRSCQNCYLKNYKDPATVSESEEENESDDEEAQPTPSTSNASNSNAAKRRRMSVINL